MDWASNSASRRNVGPSFDVAGGGAGRDHDHVGDAHDTRQIANGLGSRVLLVENDRYISPGKQGVEAGPPTSVPAVIPFLLIEDKYLALRVSNLVLVALLYSRRMGAFCTLPTARSRHGNDHLVPDARNRRADAGEDEPRYKARSTASQATLAPAEWVYTTH